jgi:hypothetical protein
MQEIEIQDLEVGDEILISCQSHFKYLRVLKQPTIGDIIHWRTQQPIYKAVKCSTNKEENYITYPSHNGGTRKYKEIQYKLTSEDHNHTRFYDLEHRQIILIKKN